MFGDKLYGPIFPLSTEAPAGFHLVFDVYADDERDVNGDIERLRKIYSGEYGADRHVVIPWSLMPFSITVDVVTLPIQALFMLTAGVYAVFN